MIRKQSSKGVLCIKIPLHFIQCILALNTFAFSNSLSHSLYIQLLILLFIVWGAGYKEKKGEKLNKKRIHIFPNFHLVFN